ncbi:MAG: PTS lactose/cellobiose transporter subunit IIA [Longicatena sp.]
MNLENAQIAMKIILHAGDARLKTTEALKALKEFNVEDAKKYLAEANEDIVAAHQVQTGILQAESNGDEIEYSTLFSHAQDTCMTVYSEINVTEQLIDICESIDKRFKALENDK